jgi:hypothetical protein
MSLSANHLRAHVLVVAAVLGITTVACSGRSTYGGGGIASFSEAGPQDPPPDPGPDLFDFGDASEATDAPGLLPVDAGVDPAPTDAAKRD